MLMTDCLPPDGCDTVRRFFAMLLQIKHLNQTQKRIDVGRAFQFWYKHEYGATKVGLTRIHKCSVDNMHRWTTDKYAYRAVWMQANPNGTPDEAAQAWGCKRQAAYQWMLEEKRRRGMMM